MGKNVVLCLVLFALLVINLTGSVLAQEDQPPPPENLEWVFTGGPRGGIGYDMQYHPDDTNIIWVTDAFAGAFLSTDGGVSWSSRNEGIDARVGASGDAIPVFSLTIDPSNPDIIWAGTQNMMGIYRSIDGGQTWLKKVNGIQEGNSRMEFRNFSIDPKDSNIVYCAGNYMANESTQEERGFIYKTTDGGENWQLLVEPDALVRWVIIDPTDSNIIYASTGIFDRYAVKPTGVLKSLDGGQTWEQINNGFNNLVVAALAMHPNDPLTLLAGTGKAPGFADEPHEVNGGIFITHDGGESWQQIDPFSEDDQVRVSAVAFAPSNPDIIYADSGTNFLRSFDGGITWDNFNVTPSIQANFMEWRGAPIKLIVDPKDPLKLFMNAYSGGVFVSYDGGQNWMDSSSGNSGAQVRGIAVDPINPGFVVAAARTGPQISFNAGQAWAGRVTNNWNGDLNSIAIDPNNREHILAGRGIDARIWYTDNGGFTWDLALGPLGEEGGTGERSIEKIVFAPSEPEIVYAATSMDPFWVFDLSTQVGPGIFKSLDGGKTWQLINNGLESSTLNIVSLDVHPENPDIAYLGEINSGMYKTVDGGVSWAPIGNSLGDNNIREIAIDPNTPETLYAGTHTAGIWKSEDGGESWKNMSIGMPAEAMIHAIIIDPSNTNTIYAADMTSGVYRSVDGGEFWQQINNGLAMRAVLDLTISENGATLYAATDGNGVYRLDVYGEMPKDVPGITAMDFLGIGDSPIQIDGNADDWAGLDILYSDPAGDAGEGFIDFTDGYAFTDGSSLYILINLVDSAASFEQIDFDFSVGSEKYLCSIMAALGNNAAMCVDVTNGYDTPVEIGVTDFSRISFGPSFGALEARFDARDFGTSGLIRLDNVMVWDGECCGEEWIQVDSWAPAGQVLTMEEYFRIPSESSGGEIQIDGSKEDWVDRAVLYEDPAGDAEGGLLDITTCSAFIKDNALHFLIDLVDPSADFVQIDMLFSSESQLFICSYLPDEGVAWCGDITEGYVEIGQANYSRFAFGPAFEGRFDFQDLGSPDGIQLQDITVWGGECCDEPAWMRVDSWVPNEPIPEE